MRPRLDWLETFIAIAETGSLTRAGERVARSQSAVSLQLRQLEATVEAQLFDRSTRHVVLTAAGERLLPHAHRAVAAADAAIASTAEDEVRVLRVGIPEEYAEGVLPELLAGLGGSAPGRPVEVQCAASDVLERRVGAGGLDLALALADEIEGDGEAIAGEPTPWFQVAGGIAAEQRPLPVALFDRSCSWRRRALDALDRAGIDYRVVLTSASVAGVRAGIRSGLAVGALGASTATADLEVLSQAGTPPALPLCELVLLRSGRDTGIDALFAGVRSAVRRAFSVRVAKDDRRAERGGRWVRGARIPE